jgi:dihydroxyacetone kinase-like protein
MEKSGLDVDAAREMLIHVALGMVESKDLLTQADQAIGDGDHGIGMARGFEAVHKRLAEQSFSSLDELFKSVGMALMTSVGGAAGAIFGTFFRGGARNLSGQTVLDSAALAQMLVDGLEAVKQRGKAGPGDKTMVDALEPAALACQGLVSAPLSVSLGAASAAAKEGMERTKDMVAKVGKAKTLGERALGYPDPGAISTFLILKLMAEYVQ